MSTIKNVILMPNKNTIQNSTKIFLFFIQLVYGLLYYTYQYIEIKRNIYHKFRIFRLKTVDRFVRGSAINIKWCGGRNNKQYSK